MSHDGALVKQLKFFVYAEANERAAMVADAYHAEGIASAIRSIRNPYYAADTLTPSEAANSASNDASETERGSAPKEKEDTPAWAIIYLTQ